MTSQAAPPATTDDGPHRPSAPNALAIRFGRLARLSEDETRLLNRLAGQARQVRAGEEILRPGRGPVAPIVIVTGFAGRVSLLSDGRQQILSLLLPGDVAELAGRPASVQDISLLALTDATVAEASALSDCLSMANGTDGGLSEACAVSRALDDVYLLHQVLRLGRQTAYERMAHFLLEARHRLDLAGIVDAARFPMPLTQQMLADLLGLSLVHVNRTLQRLRGEGMIEMSRGWVTFLDEDMLAEIAEYRSPWPSRRQA